jgi:hypothetical protein
MDYYVDARADREMFDNAGRTNGTLPALDSR